jgi:uncharacterized repeat protein (TIGR02543 family)
MRTRKIVIAVLTTALLISAMLIVGCIDQFDGIPGKKAEENYKIPAGKGVVKLNIRDIDTNARTILPDNTSLGLELQDMFFDVQFKKTSANGTGTGFVNDVVYFPGYAGTAPATKATWAEMQAPIVLDSNWKYKYVITAYNVKTGTHIPIAGCTSADDALIVGTSTVTESSKINLLGFDDGANNGNFSYDITIVYDDDYDYGNVNLIEIDPFSVTGTPKIEIVLETNALDNGTVGDDTGTGAVSGSGASKIITFADPAVSLKSGYYTVTVTLSKGTKYATKQYTEALHIYPAMTSKMTPLVIPALDKIKLDVTFSTTGSPTITNTPDLTPQLINYGKKADTPSPAPVATGYTFDGWYVATSGSDYKWDFADRVLSDLSMYAHWLGGGAEFTNITFTYSDEIDSLITTSSVGKLYIGTLDGSKTVVIDFDTGGAVWSNFVWKINDKPFTALVINDPDNDGSTNLYRLTINNLLDDGGGTAGDFEEFLVVNSTFTVSVNAILTVNSIAKPYSKVIEIQVLSGNGP